jgi:hypothetical protein
VVVGVLSGSEGRERARTALGLRSTLRMMVALGRAEDGWEAYEMSILSWSSVSQISAVLSSARSAETDLL